MIRSLFKSPASFKLTYRCNLYCLACPFYRCAGEEGARMSRSLARIPLDALKRRVTRTFFPDR